MQLRAALPSDVHHLTCLMRAFHAEIKFDLDFDPAYVSAKIRAAIDAPDHLALVLEIEGRPRGVLFAAASFLMVSPVMAAQELAWWVDPPVRSMSRARAMLDAYEAWAVDVGCGLINMVGLDDPVIARLYRARGYLPREQHFTKWVT